MAKLVALQMVSVPDVEENLATVRKHLAHLEVNEPTLVVLPECFASFGSSDHALLKLAEPLLLSTDNLDSAAPIQSALRQMARQFGVWLVAGTIPTQTSTANKFAATSLLINDKGDQVTSYQKIHLFDVEVDDNTQTYCESKYTQAGSNLCVLETPFGRLGMAVCYDLRFAGMFQAMGEIDLLVLPSAFTQRTGAAHWHPLIRARAIEKQCYVVAANQGGTHANGRQTYGHSCIISPWGEIIDEVAEGEGLSQGQQDLAEITRLRSAMPVYQHNKFRSYLV